MLTVHELAKVPAIYDRSAIVGVFCDATGVAYVVLWQAPPEEEKARFVVGERGQLCELDEQGKIKP